jgi:carbamoyltransferase
MTWESGKETPVLGRLFSPLFEQRLGPARRPEEPLEQRHRDIAASLQEALEEALFTLLDALHRQTRLDTLCMAGGVAFNCVANGKVFQRTPFRRLYIQPAAGDAGLAVGAAYYVAHHVLGQPRSFVMDHAYWGPEFRRDQLLHAIESRGLGARGFPLRELPEPELIERTADLLAAGAIVGWFQGRMEWGPRALGNRSILADPRRPEMKDILNRRIKHREPFRPFAPAIVEEAAGEYFDAPADSPFMLLAFPVRPGYRDRIPAPIHVDGTGRLQTVSRQSNPRFWALLEAFARRTGVPVLLNTSFNENEPIVCHPEEAVDCFLRTHMDALVLGDFLIEKPAHEAGASEHRLASGF